MATTPQVSQYDCKIFVHGRFILLSDLVVESKNPSQPNAEPLKIARALNMSIDLAQLDAERLYHLQELLEGQNLAMTVSEKSTG